MTSKKGENESSAFIGDEMNDIARHIFIIIGLLEIVGGVMGNLLLLAALLGRRILRMRNAHYILTANLALADIASQGYWMSFLVLDLLLGYHPVVNQVHCVVNGFILASCSAVGLGALVEISVSKSLKRPHYFYLLYLAPTSRKKI